MKSFMSAHCDDCENCANEVRLLLSTARNIRISNKPEQRSAASRNDFAERVLRRVAAEQIREQRDLRKRKQLAAAVSSVCFVAVFITGLTVLDSSQEADAWLKSTILHQKMPSPAFSKPVVVNSPYAYHDPFYVPIDVSSRAVSASGNTASTPPDDLGSIDAPARLDATEAMITAEAAERLREQDQSIKPTQPSTLAPQPIVASAASAPAMLADQPAITACPPPVPAVMPASTTQSSTSQPVSASNTAGTEPPSTDPTNANGASSGSGTTSASGASN